MSDGFGAVLRELRRRAVLTQEELADRSGVSVGTIAGLENGRVKRPRPASARRLAEALDLTADDQVRFLAAATEIPSEPGADDAPLGDSEAQSATASGARAMPRLLPPDLPSFSGRHDELLRLDELLRAGASTVTVSGMAGVGKTSLAVHWAHRAAAAFPDGHIYLDMRGFDRGGQPMALAGAVYSLLEILGIRPDRLPRSLEAQLGLYRSIVADRRLLILLDNVRGSEQVRSLLPASAGSLVVITTRHQLTGLIATDGAEPVQLDVMSPDDCKALLATRLGARRAFAEPQAVADIIRHCARLPLALAVLAARAATYPDFPLSELARQLGDRVQRLEVLNGGDERTDTRAVLSWSYEALTPPAAELFRVVGAHCDRGFTTRAAASAVGRPVAEIHAPLAELVRAHLFVERAPGRYSVHELLRTFAEELDTNDRPANDGSAAARRVLDYYLHSAHPANLLFDECRQPIDVGPTPPGITVEVFADREEALAWFSHERTVLVAAVGRALELGLPEHTWQLAWSLRTFLEWRGYCEEVVAVLGHALTAIRALAAPAVEMRIHRALSFALASMGDHEAALVHSGQALTILESLDDRPTLGHLHHDRAYILDSAGRPGEALTHALLGKEIFEELGDREQTARILNTTGWLHAQLGSPELGLRCCEESLAGLAEYPNHPTVPLTLDSIGYAHMQLGEYARSAEAYQRAIDLIGTSRLPLTATMLVRLGEAHQAGSNLPAAEKAWRQAVQLLDELRDPAAAAAVRARIDALRPPEANAEIGPGGRRTAPGPARPPAASRVVA